MKPWQVKQWVIPEASTEFVCQMEKVLDVYELPYDEKKPVVCLDESPKQLVGESKESFIDEKGVKYEDYEYVRNSAADIYVICEPLAGKREFFVTHNHCAKQWVEVVTYLVEEVYPEAEIITLIQDNLSAHKPAALYEIHTPQRARAIIEKLNIVNTPKHGSWLNIAEIEFGILKRTGLTQRIESKQQLIQQIKDYENNRNEKQKKVNWQFKTTDARIKLKKLYPKI
jgi:hypothetical protein